MLTSSSRPAEHPPVLPEDGPAVLPPGPGVVRPDEGVQVEPHHPDRQRRPRGPSRPEEAGDAAGGARDQGGLTHRPTVTCQQTRYSSMLGLHIQRAEKVFTPPPPRLVVS